MKFTMDFQNQQQSNEYVQYIKKRQKFKHQNLVQLKYVKFEQIQHWCSSHYQVTTQYEYFSDNLKKETLKLKRNGNKFSAIHMIRMIYDCIDVLASFEENDFQISEIHPSLLFLQKDEIEDLFQIKFCERISGSNDSQINKFNSLSSNLDLYMSPQDFESLSQGRNNSIQKNFKSEVFVVGLCFLEAGTRESFQDVYNLIQGKFKQDNLHKHMRRFDRVYDNEPFLQALLQKMLETNERLRPSFVELKDNLPSWHEIQKVLIDNQSEIYQNRNYQVFDNTQKSNYQLNTPAYLPPIQNYNSQLHTQFDPQSQKFVISKQDNNFNQKNSIQIPDNLIQKNDNQQNFSQDMFLVNQQQKVFSDTHQYDSNNQFQNFNLDKYKSNVSNNDQYNQNNISIEKIKQYNSPNKQQFDYKIQQNSSKTPSKVFKHLTFQQFSSQHSNNQRKENQIQPTKVQENSIHQSKEKFNINSQPVLVDSQQLNGSNNYGQIKIQDTNPLYVESQKNNFDYKKLDLNKITRNVQSSQNFMIPQYQDMQVQASNQTKETNTAKTQNRMHSYNSLLSKEKQVSERPHLRYYEKFFHKTPKIKINQSILDKHDNFLQQQYQQKIQRQKKPSIEKLIIQDQKPQQNLKPKIDTQEPKQIYDIKKDSQVPKQVQDFNIIQHSKKYQQQNMKDYNINQNPQSKKCSKKEIQAQDNYFTRQKEYTDIVQQQSNFFSVSNSVIKPQKQKQSSILKQYSNQQNSLIGFNENIDYFQDYSLSNNKSQQKISYDMFQYNNNQNILQDQQNILQNSPKQNKQIEPEQRFQNIYDLLEQNEANFGVLPSQEEGNFAQNNQNTNMNVSDDLIGFKEQISEDYNPYMNEFQEQNINQNQTFPEKSLGNKYKLKKSQQIFLFE